MRKTYCVPAAWSNDRFKQTTLDAFWNLIEDKYEEDCHVDSNGDVSLTVDEEMMIRVLADNPTVALSEFGAWEEHNPEYQKWEWQNLPDALLGTYIIKGIYAPDLSFIPGDYAKREYFFVQEGY